MCFADGLASSNEVLTSATVVDLAFFFGFAQFFILLMFKILYR